MRTTVFYLTFFILYLLPSIISAEIKITSIIGSDGYCDGSITVKATGSAGPFTVQLFGSGNLVPTYQGVDGEITLENLCNGEYEVRVFPQRFSTCVKIIEVTLVDPAAKTQLGIAQQAELADDLQLEISPNPSEGVVQLELSSKSLPPSARNEWEVRILNPEGKVLQRLSVAPQNTGSTVGGSGLWIQQTLNLSNFASGLYYLRVIRDDGVEVSGSVILQ